MLDSLLPIILPDAFRRGFLPMFDFSNRGLPVLAVPAMIAVPCLVRQFA
jgi:hypothetical protein